MSKTDLQLNIISADKKIFRGVISAVTLPGMVGGFSIHPEHAPFVSSLREGKIVYLTLDGNSHEVEIRGGFIEVNNNIVTACVE